MKRPYGARRCDCKRARDAQRKGIIEGVFFRFGLGLWGTESWRDKCESGWCVCGMKLYWLKEVCNLSVQERKYTPAFVVKHDITSESSDTS